MASSSPSIHSMNYPNSRRLKVAAYSFQQKQSPLKWSLFMAVFAVGLTFVFIPSATSQQHSLLNTPPILYVPERNWRISETEEVGQIIARIRAEDAENDELVFGLEPHLYSSHLNVNEDDDERDKLPFRIDTVAGVVYLNESLLGRGGENFFFYVTVSDGQLTAKNEVYVNILHKKDGKNSAGSRTPSFTNVVHNISQFLPSFDRLPGVQSIRNQLPNQVQSNILPPGFGMNPYVAQRPGSGNNGASNFPHLNVPPQQARPIWSEATTEDGLESIEYESEQSSTKPIQQTATTSRTKLTPLINGGHKHNSTATTTAIRPSLDNSHNSSSSSSTTTTTTTSSSAYSFRTLIIPITIAVCGLFVAAAVIFGFLYRKRLCAISKTLKKKSKEEMAKKSNQSNLSSNLTDDSRNSMVMQHWNGPMAYGNRYVPWERDQQLMQQSMLATSVGNNSLNHGVDASCLVGVVGAIPNATNAVGYQAGNVLAGAGGGGVAGTIHNNTTNSNINGNNMSKYDRWEFPRHRLKFFNILGEGAFGQVWRCEATDIEGTDGGLVTTVAVKTLKENAAEVEKRDLVSELEVMKSLEPHVNVVRFLGCCTDKDPIFVIIEYVNRGKLQTYLRNSRAERHYGNTHGKSNILTSGDLTSFMYQVAKGMDYLTSRGIIHRDLAARNILITDDHTCKVADFGFARDVITSKIYERKSEGKLPIRWMAIESLYDNIFSVKSDIWSFGILMWEIVTLGSTPYPGISAADVMRKVRDGYRLEKPEHCRRELYNIMYYCWSSDPNERPTFSDLIQMLDKLLHTEMDYIQLEQFPDHNYYNIVNPSGEKV